MVEEGEIKPEASPSSSSSSLDGKAKEATVKAEPLGLGLAGRKRSREDATASSSAPTMDTATAATSEKEEPADKRARTNAATDAGTSGSAQLTTTSAPASATASSSSSSSSSLVSSFHFGFPIHSVTDLSRVAVQLKRRADLIKDPSASLRAQQEKYATYVVAAIFWLEHAVTLLSAEVRTRNSHASLPRRFLALFFVAHVVHLYAVLCVARVQKSSLGTMSVRQDSARKMCADTMTFLSFSSMLPALDMPWLIVILSADKTTSNACNLRAFVIGELMCQPLCISLPFCLFCSVQPTPALHLRLPVCGDRFNESEARKGALGHAYAWCDNNDT
jgi:hypothetical protein